MSFAEAIQHGWENHDKDPGGVFERARAGIELLEEAGQVPALAKLLFHVGAEHLGKPRETLLALKALQHRKLCGPTSQESVALARTIAACHLCFDDSGAAGAALSAAGATGSSDRGIVHTLAAGVLAARGDAASAKDHLDHAVLLSERGDTPADLARAIASTANNIAASLEEVPGLDTDSRALLHEAAKLARRFWELAGNWTHVERAEYRLSSACCKLGMADDAVRHAEECLAICVKNEADAAETFFAQEIRARAHTLAGNRQEAVNSFESARELVGQITDPGMRSWCEETLEKLARTVGA
ncbi:MAG: hypothetical protein HY816_01590 [Candidatus Wallbacteria bacterium]|nr:hypothetical protein [Candidatus Wallbacteria bacterium]